MEYGTKGLNPQAQRRHIRTVYEFKKDVMLERLVEIDSNQLSHALLILGKAFRYLVVIKLVGVGVQREYVVGVY